MDLINKIIKGDCINTLKQIPDKTFDFCFADPPYFMQIEQGKKLFQQCFNPQKITVFGVGKNTQDIYNAECLKKIIDKTIITKTFEDVVGKKIYTIHQHTVKFNDAEENLYYKAINEFYSMKYLWNIHIFHKYTFFIRFIIIKNIEIFKGC